MLQTPPPHRCLLHQPRNRPSGQLLQGMPQVRQPQQPPKGEMLPDESAGQPEEAISAPDAAAETVDTVCRKPDDVNSIPGCCNKNRLHKKKEKERKENILPNPPCEGGDEEGGESLLVKGFLRACRTICHRVEK